MSRAVILTLVLAAAALAGCTAGNDGAQLPGAQSGEQREAQDAQGKGRGAGQDGAGQGNDGWRGDLQLEVDPKQGLAPLDVTIRYDIGGRENPGRGHGASGNSTGNATGNATGTSTSTTTGSPSGNTTGNSTGTSTGTPTGIPTGNATAGSGGNATAQANVTWTLVLWRMQPDEAANETGNATGPGGNATGNATGNSTGSQGNSTGNSTGNTTNSTGNSTGTSDGNGTGDQFPQGPGNLTLSINGTLADLPGVTVQRINATGHYKVRFTVDYGNGTTHQRTAVVHVRALQDGDALGNETRTFEGSFLASEPLLCLGSEEFEWVLNDTFGGHGAIADRINATLEADGMVDDYTLTLVAPNGTELASGPAIDLAGPLEAGNYTLRVDSCVAADTAFTVAGLVDYVYSAAADRARAGKAAGATA